MISPGTLISNRYEILEKIGSGGMADVYKATDSRLNRYVAVKILKAEYSTDKGFITRFKNEAQSAAGLSHPNIVSVYDVGDDEEGRHYIVMELVEGITLKKFIEKKGRLEIREAVGIAIQIAQGMEAAHDKHIIHRDIKPQNIMISKDGKVKVADFGIAKVVSSDTFTQTAVGSVHYLSPEQARGGYSDERGDIYSLGVSLYEMLTGQLPFGGDRDVTVALAHIQNEPKHARELVPSIPYALDRVVQKCMQKHPENRYNSASELIMDLKHSITNPDGDFVTIDDGSSVITQGTKKFDPAEFNEIKAKAALSDMAEHEQQRKANNSDSKILREEYEELDTIDSKWEKAITLISILFVIGVCGGLIYLIVHFLGVSNIANIATTPTPKIEATSTPTPTATPTMPLTFPMPNLYGYTIEDAQKMMAVYSKDIVVLDADESVFSTEPEGTIIDQSPKPDSSILFNAEVKVWLSAGPEPVDVPRVIGLPQDAATAALVGKGFEVSPVFEPSDMVSDGLVIRTDPANGEQAPTGSKIILYISSGAAVDYTVVPSLIGQTKEAAIAMIEQAGLTVGQILEDYSEDQTEGYVCKQSVDANKTAFNGDAIDITVSTGPYPEGYVPTPTPEPTKEIPKGERKYYIAKYETAGLDNPVGEGEEVFFSFEISQDGKIFFVVVDYNSGDIDMAVSRSRFSQGFTFKLYTDYNDYGDLHEGTAVITAYLEGNNLESQIITLEEFKE